MKVTSTTWIKLIVVVVLIIVLMFLVFKNHPMMRDYWVKNLRHSIDTPFLEQCKNDKHWKTVIHKSEKIPYLWIDETDMKEKDVAKKKYYFICHGATTTLENAYTEYLNISQKLNIVVVVVEYPGFGSRKDQLKKLNQPFFIDNYPLEIAQVVQDNNIPHSQLYILGTCAGAYVASAIAS